MAALADRLRALLVEAREHPLAAVRLELEASGADPLRLTYRFIARGSEPIFLTVASLRARVVEAPSEPSEPPPLAWVREAAPLDTGPAGPAELAPGETLTLEGATSAPAGRLRVDGFARVALDSPRWARPSSRRRWARAQPPRRPRRRGLARPSGTS